MSAAHSMPVTFGFFTSTRGHFGRKTDWRVTLDHWDKQVPLGQFNLVAHLKTSPGDEVLATEMATEMGARGFHVIQTVGNWTRGLSHGANYLGDQVTMSKDRRVYDRPYFMLVEDDSPVISSQVPLEDLLLQSCDMLRDDHELVTVRVRRKEDDRGPTVAHPQPDPRYFYSEHTNFQPILLRSLDYYRLCMALEANPDACQQVQCEALWRLVLDSFSRSPHKHIVYETDYAHTPHIGVADPTTALAQLSITQ